VALFWYAEPVRARRLSPRREKYINADKQINPNLQNKMEKIAIG
jgi:hypothetical protein